MSTTNVGLVFPLIFCTSARPSSNAREGEATLARMKVRLIGTGCIF